MPKMRSHSGAKKRFRKSASGKWTHKKAGLRHLLTPMSSNTGRFLRRAGVLDETMAESKVLNRYLPYK